MTKPAAATAAVSHNLSASCIDVGASQAAGDRASGTQGRAASLGGDDAKRLEQEEDRLLAEASATSNR